MKDKKTIIYSAIALVTLALLVVGATYAYFQNQYGSASNADVKVLTYTTDVLTFETGDAIILTLDQDNFAKGKGNQTGSTYASALLRANNKTNTATANYSLYLSIYTNTFGYSINSDTPELLLQVTDNDGNTINNIAGLTSKTITDASGATLVGYDVTTKTGLLKLIDNKEIIASPSKEEKWNFKIIVVNYNEDQSANAGKTFEAKIIVKNGGYNPTIADYCSDGENLNDCVVKFGNLGYEVSKINIHNANLENGAGDNSYRYSGGNAHGDLYSCKYDGNDVQNFAGNINSSNKGDCSNVYKMCIGMDCFYKDRSFEEDIRDKKTVSWDSTNNKCITSSGDEVYTVDNTEDTAEQDKCTGTAYFSKINNMYLLGIEEVGSGEETLVLLAEEGINNFVCFGSDEEECPIDNLYRIIGIIDGKVKLIKYDYATSDLLGKDGAYSQSFEEFGEINAIYKGSTDYSKLGMYIWNSETKTNTWSESNLNKINLNVNFLNNIGTTWKNKIDDTTWKVGGNVSKNLIRVTPKIAYQNEIVNPNPTNTSKTGEIEYTAKVGLMYLSDYYYAASTDYWTLPGSDSGDNYTKAINSNWIYAGSSQWTISRNSDGSSTSIFIDNEGRIYSGVNYTIECGVQPVFNLKNDITYKSGIGSIDNPIRLS